MSQGEISLDAILAFPIDWQGLASEHQWSKARELQGEERIPTMNPLATKNRTRSQRQQPALTASPVSSTSDEDISSQSQSMLGLQLTIPAASDVYLSSEELQKLDSDYPSSPELSFNISTPASPSSSDFSVSTPTLSLLSEENISFDLKSYCSAFNDSGLESWPASMMRLEA